MCPSYADIKPFISSYKAGWYYMRHLQTISLCWSFGLFQVVSPEVFRGPGWPHQKLHSQGQWTILLCGFGDLFSISAINPDKDGVWPKLSWCSARWHLSLCVITYRVFCLFYLISRLYQVVIKVLEMFSECKLFIFMIIETLVWQVFPSCWCESIAVDFVLPKNFENLCIFGESEVF